MNVDDLIAKARAEVAEAPPVTKHVMLGGEMVGVRYRPLPGDQWRALKARFLPRDGSFFDQNLGFNIDEVTRAFPNMSIVRDGEVDDLRRPGDDGKTRYIWPDVFSALDDPAIEIIAQSLWETHQYLPQQRMVEAGKALRTGRAKKRSSRSNSASQSAN